MSKEGDILKVLSIVCVYEFKEYFTEKGNVSTYMLVFSYLCVCE